MEKLSPTRVQHFLRNKHTVFHYGCVVYWFWFKNQNKYTIIFDYSRELILIIELKSVNSLPGGALRKFHLHLCYHMKEVQIVALPFLYNMRLVKYVATKLQ